MLRNIFGFLWKTENVLEKFRAGMSVLKIQICSGKIEKVEKIKMMEGENEIHTDFPSARARHLESDERDLSPAVFTTARLVLENWSKMSLRPYATPSLYVFFLIVWS